MKRKPNVRAVVDENGCWIWQHGVNHGYARIWTEGEDRSVHRLVYERVVGPIPKGMDLHHECGNKLCVRPSHLRPLSNSDHTRLHGLSSARRGSNNPRAKINEDDVRAIRQAWANGETYTAIGARYGLYSGHVSDIVRGKSWAHVPTV